MDDHRARLLATDLPFRRCVNLDLDVLERNLLDLVQQTISETCKYEKQEVIESANETPIKKQNTSRLTLAQCRSARKDDV